MAELPQDRSHLAALGTLAADAILRTEQAAAYAVAHATPAQLVIALSVLGVLWAAVRWMRQREISGGRNRVERERDPPLPCFGSLVSFLGRRGLAHGGSEPLEHFARRLEDAGLKEAARLVERYAALRYGGVGDRGALERDVAWFVRGEVSTAR